MSVYLISTNVLKVWESRRIPSIADLQGYALHTEGKSILIIYYSTRAPGRLGPYYNLEFLRRPTTCTVQL